VILTCRSGNGRSCCRRARRAYPTQGVSIGSCDGIPSPKRDSAGISIDMNFPPRLCGRVLHVQSPQSPSSTSSMHFRQQMSRQDLFESVIAYLARVDLLAREGVFVGPHFGGCGVRWVLCFGFVALKS
jgi:hypothetical protein